MRIRDWLLCIATVFGLFMLSYVASLITPV